ncbi:hypothetical protein D7Z54_14645 [Salibacterium salarium]|uniref:Uncharacterized protein n=1 Tax=Salibacterium salarium TaxID=284579 RepID=A0A428N2I1_9BACI|nr:hypothetical protein [Salibacterium salarium]RSL32685.1 hypothetical protein D7Z54_14645 [Salibacterium salarium]
MIEERYMELADRFIITDYLIKVLEQDKQQFEAFKLSEEYKSLMDHTIIRVREDMRTIKKTMYDGKIKVVTTSGASEDFIYFTVYQGNQDMNMSFLRAQLRNRVGQLFKYYMMGDERFFAEDYYANPQNGD